jgi:leader peptidase (prepilin peptidase)/N-methyltransferase
MSGSLLTGLLLVSFLVPLAFIDAEHWILPFELTVPGIIAGVTLGLRQGPEGAKAAALGAVVGFLAFRAVEWFGWLAFKKEAMGAGDKYLVALSCSMLGAPALLGMFLLSSFQGSIWGVLMLALKGRAGPPPDKDAEKAAPRTMTWEFARPGLPLWKRVGLFPINVLFQPIPDDPKDEKGNEVEWSPDPTSLPYGPWLALSAVEILLVGPWLAEHVPLVGWVFGMTI